MAPLIRWPAWIKAAGAREKTYWAYMWAQVYSGEHHGKQKLSNQLGALPVRLPLTPADLPVLTAPSRH